MRTLGPDEIAPLDSPASVMAFIYRVFRDTTNIYIKSVGGSSSFDSSEITLHTKQGKQFNISITEVKE